MDWIEHQEPALTDGGSVRLVAYVGQAADGRYDNPHHGLSEPQAYRVDTPPGQPPLRTHFHTVDQFQYVGWGAGRIGSHPVAAGCLHYADRFTPYGPLRAGDGGYSYLTLRGTTDMGISYMPESRHELADRLGRLGRDPNGRRSLTLDLRSVVAAPGPGGWTRLVDDADGLVIAVADCAAGQDVQAPEIGSAGAWLVVVDGAAVGAGDAGVPVGPGAVRWCDPGSSPTVVAGEIGARVALLAFPDGGS
ncbi:MAG TPA: hypothetical protein VE623_13825 [Acidimicrobiales bacterium]|nr:hypothetical protein [Acidimicrobiales bacterium]